jgi:hypothetical protein
MANEYGEVSRSIASPDPEDIQLGVEAQNLIWVIERAIYDEPNTLEERAFADPRTLVSIVEFDHQLAGFAVDLEPQASRRINHFISIYHEALPFNCGERRWLTHTIMRLSEDHLQRCDRIDQLATMEGGIISQGLPCAARGGELMRRWSAWRAQTDEFAKAGTFDLARVALAGLGGVLLANHHRANEYPELQAVAYTL